VPPDLLSGTKALPVCDTSKARIARGVACGVQPENAHY
jgi:hypothetical protein